MIKQLSILLVGLLVTSPLFVFSKMQYGGSQEVVLVGSLESANSFISFVTVNGHKYIVKQKKRFNSQLGAVRDAFAAYIAQELAIAQSVEIIPSNIPIVGKINSLWPATLHTIAAGKTVRSQPESRYYYLCLKQRLPNGKVTGQWLTETIIDQITWHKQLAIIIALDLFICNTDRHGGNLFYDPKKDKFCAIDMDGIFRRDLPEFACEKLDLMVNVKNKQFTRKEIRALKRVRKTLQFLSDRYTVQHLIDKFHFFVDQAGFVKGSPLYTERIKNKIVRHELMIIKSRVSLYKLIIALDAIINSFYARRFKDSYSINEV